MSEANGSKTPRRRHGVSTPKEESQKDSQQKKQGKGSGKGTKSIKYVKLEKERPSLTRDVKKGESQKKNSRKRGSGKGKKPELIDLDPPQVKQSRKDGRTEHYGVAITTEELIRLMGDHIPRA